MQLKKSRKKIYLFLFLGLLLIIFFLYHVFQLEQLSKKQNSLLQQSVQKFSFLQNLYIDVKNIESGQRGYLISGDTIFLSNYNKGFNELKNDRELCLYLFNEEEIKQTKYDSILFLIDQKITFCKDAVDIKNQFGIDSAQEFIATGKGIYLMSQIDNKMIAAQDYFLSNFNIQTIRNEQHFFDRRNNFIAIALLFSFIFIIFYFLLKNYFSLQLKKEKDLKYNQALVSNIYDAIISCDINFNIKKWNLLAEKIFLYKESEVLGKNLFSTLNIKDENNQLDEIVAEFQKNKKWKGELINHDKNGREIFVEVSASILTDENNQTIGNVSVIRDITDNKFNESTLEQHSKSLEIELQRKLEDLTIINERLLLISKATNDAIWDWKIGTDRIWGNESYLNLLDQKDSDFINYNYFISKIHEDDRQLLNSNFNKVIQDKKTSSIAEFRFMMPNGVWQHFLNKSLYIYNNEGSLIRVLGALQNITIQKEIEQKIISEMQVTEGIINSLPGIFYMFNKEGKYLKWNYNFLKITGFTEKDMEVIHPLQFFSENQKDFVESIIKNVFLNGSDNIEIELITKNNEKIPYYFTGSYIKYNNEDCLMGVGIDISEKTNYQNQLRDLALHIQNIREEERTSISREIHDELGQQLTALNMDISWLRKNLLNPPSQVTSKLELVVDTLKNAIKSLHSISTKLRPSILDDLGLVSAMEWQSEEFEKRFNIQSVFISDLRNIQISTDIATTIFRIYQESLTNILKHSKASKVIATLIFESGQISLSVTDNGIGFDESKIENKKSFGLLGIKERTLLLNGTFGINGDKEEGTTIVIKIPYSI